MLLYLDLNCFNRPFDDQSQARIAEETKAVFTILQQIQDGTDTLVWSSALTFENSNHPLKDRRDEIGRWEQRASINQVVTATVQSRADELCDTGFQALDSIHLACAETASCECFLSCDDRLLQKSRRVQLKIAVKNPAAYMKEFPNG